MKPPAGDPAEARLDFTPPERPSPLRSSATPFLVLLVGLGLTFVVARYFEHVNERRNQARFDRAAQHVHDAIEEQVSAYITLLRGTAALFAVKPELSEAEFKLFVDRLRLAQHHPGVRGIGYAAHRPQDGGDTFPIVLLEPHDDRNLRVLGYDMFAEPIRRAAMARARDTGEASASRRVTLRQEYDRDVQPGFLIYLPVFEGGTTPPTVGERRAKLRGFAYAPFRAGDLLDAIFAHDLTPDVDFELYDGNATEPAALLYRGGDPSPRAAYQRIDHINVAGVTWTLANHSTRAFEASLEREIGTEITFAGALFSLALFAVVFALYRTQLHAARSERQIRVAFASLADGVVVTDTQGRVTFLNAAAETLTGASSAQARNRPVEDVCLFVEARGLRPVSHPVREVLRTGEQAATREPVLLASGGHTERPVDARAAPIRHESGRLLGVAMTVRDITDQRRAEVRLRRSEARNRAILTSALDPIITVDQTGVIAGFNPAAERTFGYREDEVVGRRLDEAVFAPESRAACRRSLDRFAGSHADGLGSKRIELEAMRADASRFPCELAVAIADVDGVAPFFTAYLHDITERVEAQRKLQAHAAELETRVAARTRELSDLNAQLEALADSIAHDLRSPLRGLQGYSKLLLEDHSAQLDEGGRHYIHRIHQSARFLDNLIVDLLSYGRLSRKQLVLGPVNLDDAWQAALFQSQHRVERTHAQVNAFGPWPRVRGHESTLTQVLANLLSNSLKFVAEDVRPEITFRTETHGTTVRLWLEDNGIGIPAEQHEKIFGVFTRLNGSAYPGTGIGLSLVKKGVERMGGTIGLESEPGRGTRFWIDLPAA